MTSAECRECKGHVYGAEDAAAAKLYDDELWSPVDDLCGYCLIARVRAELVVTLPIGTNSRFFYDADESPTIAALCERCDGTGTYLVSATQIGTDCWKCDGYGYVLRTKKGVQRTARWWATYHANRTKSVPGVSSGGQAPAAAES